jgi:hypothetical protein
MYGDLPYSYHLDKVAEVVDEFIKDRVDLHQWDAAKSVGYLHDTLEDTSTPMLDLIVNFGRDIAFGVYGLTNETGGNRKERFAKTYPKIRMNVLSYVGKLADRIANMRASIAAYEKIGTKNDILFMYGKEYTTFKAELFDAKMHFSAEWSFVIADMWQELDNLAECIAAFDILRKANGL